MTSQLRHHYIVSCRASTDGTFNNFFVGMISANNYETFKFVKVTAKILLIPLFQTRCIVNDNNK